MQCGGVKNNTEQEKDRERARDEDRKNDRHT